MSVFSRNVDELEYEIHSFNNGEKLITKITFTHSYDEWKLHGRFERWVKIATDYISNHPYEIVEVFYESVDEQTGHVYITQIPEIYILSRLNVIS